MLSALLADRMRPLRFAIVGGSCAVTQLGVLAVLLTRPLSPFVANLIAFLIAAQMNFLLNQTLTWYDRKSKDRAGGRLLNRWLTFHAYIAGTAAVNLTVFAVAHFVVPPLVASALGLLGAAALNFIANDRVTFRAARAAGSQPVVLRDD